MYEPEGECQVVSWKTTSPLTAVNRQLEWRRNSILGRRRWEPASSMTVGRNQRASVSASPQAPGESLNLSPHLPPRRYHRVLNSRESAQRRNLLLPYHPYRVEERVGGQWGREGKELQWWNSKIQSSHSIYTCACRAAFSRGVGKGNYLPVPPLLEIHSVAFTCEFAYPWYTEKPFARLLSPPPPKCMLVVLHVHVPFAIQCVCTCIFM